jgi:hypothetical protein
VQDEHAGERGDAAPQAKNAGNEIKPTPNRNQSVPNHSWMYAVQYEHREKPGIAAGWMSRDCRVP